MSILDEIKQHKPFESREQEAAVTLLRTADVVRRHLGSVIGRHGITAQQYNVLRILRGAEPGGLPTLEIASRMIEEAPGITRLLERLEKKKLVSRCRRNDDKRCVDCRITPAGRTLLAQLDAPVRDAAGDAFHNVNKLELGQLVQALDHVRQSLRKKEES
jgi:MarR family transcriptional regulator, organic hydroperoxide resistance regulator